MAERINKHRIEEGILLQTKALERLEKMQPEELISRDIPM
jgi:hypothetical protein